MDPYAVSKIRVVSQLHEPVALGYDESCWHAEYEAGRFLKTLWDAAQKFKQKYVVLNQTRTQNPPVIQFKS